MIAEIYFRIDNDEYIHEKYVFGVMDWLGEVGGITELLGRFFTFIIGGYLAFN